MTTVLEQPAAEKLLDERALSKLRWRCRRGLLENDLFVERFFARYDTCLTVSQAQALNELMDLADNDLLDLLLGRTEPGGEIDTRDVKEVLGMLRTREAAFPDVSQAISRKPI